MVASGLRLAPSLRFGTAWLVALCLALGAWVGRVRAQDLTPVPPLSGRVIDQTAPLPGPESLLQRR